VGGSVGRREGVESVDAAKEDLQVVAVVRKKRTSSERKKTTHCFGINVKVVLIIVYTPEGSIARVRDVTWRRTECS
jgi:hypothetical protein